MVLGSALNLGAFTSSLLQFILQWTLHSYFSIFVLDYSSLKWILLLHSSFLQWLFILVSIYRCFTSSMDPPFLFLYIHSSLCIVHSWFCSSPMDSSFLFLYSSSLLLDIHYSFFSSTPDSTLFILSSVDSSLLLLLLDSSFLVLFDSLYWFFILCFFNSFFIPSFLQWILYSYVLCLHIHSLCLTINQVLGSALNLGLFVPDYYYSSFFITSTKLLLSSFKSVYNLHNFIRPFILYPVSLYVIFMYPYTQQNTIIFYRRFKSMPPISFPLFIYSHLYSSLQSSILPT